MCKNTLQVVGNLWSFEANYQEISVGVKRKKKRLQEEVNVFISTNDSHLVCVYLLRTPTKYC